MRKVLSFVLFVSAFLVSGDCSGAQPAAPRNKDWIQQEIQPYVECRAIAEDLVSNAKQKFKDDPKALELARDRYSVALGKSEAYLGKLKTSVAQHQKKVDFKNEAKALVASVQALHDVVRPGTSMRTPIGIAELIKGLIDGAIAIWKEFRAQQQAEIDRLLGILNESRWRTWDATSG